VASSRPRPAELPSATGPTPSARAARLQLAWRQRSS